MTVDAFVSYPHPDQQLADAVVNTLEHDGVRCWIAPRDVPPGADWAGSIIQAIQRSRVLVLVFSDATNESEHILREVRAAADAGVPILPFRTTEIEPQPALRYYIGGTHWLDALTEPVERHLAELSRTVRRLLGPTEDAGTASAPAAPPGPAAPREPSSSWWERLPTRARMIGAAAAVLAVVVAVVIASGAFDDNGDETVDTTSSTQSDSPGAAAGTGDGADAPDPTPTANTAATDGVDPSEPDDAVPPADDSSGASGDGTGDTALPPRAELTGRGSIVRVSVATDGTQANGESGRPSISADGRHVAFQSVATNLVEGDSGTWQDVFVHDRETGITTRITETVTDAGVIEADGDSRAPQLSADGRYVAYSSEATNLDPALEDGNGVADVFLHDRETGITTLLSRRPDGAQHALHSIEPSMSDDGSVVAYATFREAEIPYFGGSMSALFTTWVHDRTAGTTVLLAEFPFSDPHTGICTAVGPRVSADGSMAAADCASLGARTWTRGEAASEAIATDRPLGFVTPGPTGDVIYFADQDPDVWPDPKWDAFVHDVATGEQRMLGELGTTWSMSIWSLSSDGRVLALDGSDQGAGFADVFLVDTTDGTTVSLARDLGLVLSDTRVDLSGTGGLTAFTSELDEFVPGDTNGSSDVFVLQLRDDPPELAGG